MLKQLNPVFGDVYSLMSKYKRCDGHKIICEIMLKQNKENMGYI